MHQKDNIMLLLQLHKEIGNMFLLLIKHMNKKLRKVIKKEKYNMTLIMVKKNMILRNIKMEKILINNMKKKLKKNIEPK